MSGDPQPCTMCGGYFCNGIHHIAPMQTFPVMPMPTINNWTFSRLSDDDIEKIAQRVVELLKETFQ